MSRPKCNALVCFVRWCMEFVKFRSRGSALVFMCRERGMNELWEVVSGRFSNSYSLREQAFSCVGINYGRCCCRGDCKWEDCWEIGGLCTMHREMSKRASCSRCRWRNWPVLVSSDAASVFSPNGAGAQFEKQHGMWIANPFTLCDMIRTSLLLSCLRNCSINRYWKMLLEGMYHVLIAMHMESRSSTGSFDLGS